MSAILRRGRRAADNFTSVANEAVRDSSLSFKARGILVYLMSHSDGWQINVSYLAKSGNCGRDAVLSGLKELREAGYLEMTKVRNERGQLSNWEYSVSDYPQSDNPTVVPQSGYPESGYPTSDNPTTKEEHSFKKNILKEEHVSAPSADNTADGDPLSTKRGQTKPVPLPDDWEPTARHHEKATRLNVDIDLAADRMRQWAIAKDARREKWNSVFNSFLASAPRRASSSASNRSIDWDSL